MHVQHNVVHVIQGHVRKLGVVEVVVAFRQTVANHGDVAESLLVEVYDVVVEQVLHAQYITFSSLSLSLVLPLSPSLPPRKSELSLDTS